MMRSAPSGSSPSITSASPGASGAGIAVIDVCERLLGERRARAAAVAPRRQRSGSAARSETRTRSGSMAHASVASSGQSEASPVWKKNSAKGPSETKAGPSAAQPSRWRPRSSRKASCVRRSRTSKPMEWASQLGGGGTSSARCRSERVGASSSTSHSLWRPTITLPTPEARAATHARAASEQLGTCTATTATPGPPALRPSWRMAR
ncbi:MAG: hypothetical protein M5U28_46475 [Sandaracinaceae bacterium]|nr:hypothetical protein [Sandaracinaceae bacterium]